MLQIRLTYYKIPKTLRQHILESPGPVINKSHQVTEWVFLKPIHFVHSNFSLLQPYFKLAQFAQLIINVRSTYLFLLCILYF